MRNWRKQSFLIFDRYRLIMGDGNCVDITFKLDELIFFILICIPYFAR